MRLTFQMLGLELDLTFGPATATEDATDEGAALNGGTLGSTEMAVGETSKWLGETGIEMEPPDDRRIGFTMPHERRQP